MDGFYFEQVDYVFEVFFSVDWQLYWYGDGIQFGFQLVNDFGEVGIGVVYFVDECDVWYFVVVGLVLYGF